MQTFQVLERLQAFLNLLQDEHESLLDFLKLLAKYQEPFNVKLKELLEFTADISQIPNLVGVYRNTINAVQPEIKLNRPKRIFNSIRALREALVLLGLEVSSEEATPDANINSYLNSFENAYEKFIDSYSSYSTLHLVNTGTLLLHSLLSLQEVCNLMLESLEDHYHSENSDGYLSILLDSDHTYEDFVIKLEALYSLYSEACRLLSVSESDFPLRIIKVESGSIFIKVFGNSKVIELISSLIKDATSFLYRTKTTEGKITSIPKSVEAIEEVLKLREKLHQQGIEVPGLDEEIAKSSVVVASKLSKLLEGESLVKLNGEILQIDGYKTQKVLEGKKPYLLEGSKDSAEETE